MQVQVQVPTETKNANIWRTWLARGPESLAATPFRDHNALAVHRSGLERTAFSHQVCQAKPWKLPVIRSENYSRAFRQEPDFSVFASKRLPHIAVGRKSSSLPCGSCHGLAECPHDMAAAVFPQSEWSKRKNKVGIRVPFIDWVSKVTVIMSAIFSFLEASHWIYLHSKGEEVDSTFWREKRQRICAPIFKQQCLSRSS